MGATRGSQSPPQESKHTLRLFRLEELTLGENFIVAAAPLPTQRPWKGPSLWKSACL